MGKEKIYQNYPIYMNTLYIAGLYFYDYKLKFPVYTDPYGSF